MFGVLRGGGGSGSSTVSVALKAGVRESVPLKGVLLGVFADKVAHLKAFYGNDSLGECDVMPNWGWSIGLATVESIYIESDVDVNIKVLSI